MSRPRSLVDVLHLVEFSVSYSEVLRFQYPLFNVDFDDFVSDSELEPENRFWKFITDSFNNNEGTTTGANTTHAMGKISCETT